MTAIVCSGARTNYSQTLGIWMKSVRPKIGFGYERPTDGLTKASAAIYSDDETIAAVVEVLFFAVVEKAP